MKICFLWTLIVFFAFSCETSKAALVDYSDGQTHDIDYNWARWGESNLSGTIEVIGPAGRVVIDVLNLEQYQIEGYRPLNGCVDVLNDTTVNLTRLGTISDISSYHDAQIHIYGGNILSYKNPNDFTAINAYGQSKIYIYGSSFNLPLGQIQDTNGLLLGVLDDGKLIDINYKRDSTASIYLVPEPNSLCFFGLGFLSIVKKKKR